MEPSVEIALTSIVLYSILALLCLLSVVFSYKDRHENGQYLIHQTFHVFLGLFLVCRIMWSALKMSGTPTDATFILNRLGFNLFFSAFTLVLFLWAESFHKSYIVSNQFLPRLKWGFIITNIVTYLIQFVLATFFLAGNSHFREGNPLYEMNIDIQIIIGFLVSSGFLVYGIRLYCLNANIDNQVAGNERRKELIKLFFVTVIFSICFFIRVAMFLYRPITKKFLNLYLFQTFAYYVPEIIPCLLQLYMIHTSKIKEQQASKFIDELYRTDEEELQAERESWAYSASAILPNQARYSGTQPGSYGSQTFITETGVEPPDAIPLSRTPSERSSLIKQGF
eukprot:TRINITY_DN3781_c0_g1_i1.p1 TRINITY_DN3781_c0_g1~~TRINITY_DN3781_c0_g1_i1.p1  ORF type:complete len:338 (-),score=27.76 TRINITY_DN3781_c0_g1_i1:183-1196(-)